MIEGLKSFKKLLTARNSHQFYRSHQAMRILRIPVGLLLLAILAKIKANENEAFHPTAKITGIDVDGKISQNGAVITIYGSGFAKNFIGNDGQPDDNIGNKVK